MYLRKESTLLKLFSLYSDWLQKSMVWWNPHYYVCAAVFQHRKHMLVVVYSSAM